MKLTQSAKPYDLIKSAIIRLELEPGQQIAQPQLAEKYGIGVTPIREALQRLASENFLTAVPRYGYIVTPITVPDVHEIYELRAILEPQAARLAVERGTVDALERIHHAADFSYKYGDKESVSIFVEKNAEFHLSIAQAAGNQRLIESISKTLDEMSRIFHLGLYRRDMTEDVFHEHSTIADAICSRDPQRSEETVREEILRSKERILDVLLTNAAAAGLTLSAPAWQFKPGED